MPISAYFYLTAPLARRSSQAFLARALQKQPTWRDTFSHLFVFATTILDRVYLVNGRHRELTVDVKNESVLWDAMKPGRGCLLLGSHLGSYELLGMIGSVEKKLAINVVMHLEQSAQLRHLVFRSGKLLPYNVIALGQPGSMLQVRECLARGEIVAILADRVYGDEPTHSLPFLGRAARFTLSPWRLARITGAPVVTVFGLFLGGRRYEIAFEGLDGPIDERSDARHPDKPPAGLQAYVDRLERNARRFPYNWFNFYDYWNA